MKKRVSLALGILLSANLLPITAIAETQTTVTEDKIDSIEQNENINNNSVDIPEDENLLEETAKDESDMSEVSDETEESAENHSGIDNKNGSQETTGQPIINTENSRATHPVSDESFTLTTNIEEFRNYSTSSYAILGLSGTFTLDESQVTNGETVTVADVSVSASVAGFEGRITNNTSTTIKNESGEILGTLSLEGTSLVLKISSDYTLKDNQEKFTFSNTTALKFFPTEDMLRENVDVVETITIGEASVNITFYQQEIYDLTTLSHDEVNLQLSSGTSGYASSGIYDIAYNQAGLTELQTSNGSSASPENLYTGDYQVASTLSSNVIPTGGTIFLSTYIASESNSKLQTNNDKGLASIPATSHEKTVSLPLKTLSDGLSLEQIKAQVNPGGDAIYASKQSDGSYLVLQNISEATLTISEELLRDTANASTTSTDPNGDATVEYYGKALNNRATQAISWVNFEYVDPSISNTVTTELLDSNNGNVIHSASKDSLPQVVIVEGQSTVKEHYVDESGNPLDNVTITHGWPTSDVSQGGTQYNSSAKVFEDYTLNTKATSISGITLSDSDKIATANTLKVDYPKAGNVTNIYYVYAKKLQKAIINYIDDTTGETLKADIVTGVNEQEIEYTTEDKIQEYEDAGYELVSNSFKDGEEKFDSDYSQDQVFEVHLTKEEEQELPIVPEVPVDPENPEAPKEVEEENTFVGGVSTEESQQEKNTDKQLPETGEKNSAMSYILGITLLVFGLTFSAIRLKNR